MFESRVPGFVGFFYESLLIHVAGNPWAGSFAIVADDSRPILTVSTNLGFHCGLPATEGAS